MKNDSESKTRSGIGDFINLCEEGEPSTIKITMITRFLKEGDDDEAEKELITGKTLTALGTAYDVGRIGCAFKTCKEGAGRCKFFVIGSPAVVITPLEEDLPAEESNEANQVKKKRYSVELTIDGRCKCDGPAQPPMGD